MGVASNSVISWKTCAVAVAAFAMFSWASGIRAEERARTYLPVEDLPPPRAVPAMTPDERAKVFKDLSAVRDRQISKGVKR